MQTIKITEAFQATLYEISALGKTPWVIINGDHVVGAYKSRADARNAKADRNLEGKILTANEIMWEVVSLADAAQALQDDFDAASQVALAEEEKPAEKAAKAPVLNTSSIERPCKRVWAIADDMKISHPGAKRKDILAECVKQGIAYYTARTQYQQWLGIQKEMAEREAAQAAKAAK